jgi:hypothetical protein
MQLENYLRIAKFYKALDPFEKELAEMKDKSWR